MLIPLVQSWGSLIKGPFAGMGIMDKMAEVLLTVWALSQESELPTLKLAFPARLQGAFRKARAFDYIVVEEEGARRRVYLDDLGAAYLDERGLRI